MNIIEESYKELFGKEPTKNLSIKYSGRYKAYNARIVMDKNDITVHASKTWRGISKDIQKGLIQELMVKLFNFKKHTINMDLYSNFIKSLPRYTVKTQTDAILEESFNRVNEKQFGGRIEQPNLIWGKGISQLGKYEYATDTVSISRILAERADLLDYVMYHELLHKVHKFKAYAGRHRHHTTKFKKDEEAYPNQQFLEKELGKQISRSKSPLLSSINRKLYKALSRCKRR